MPTWNFSELLQISRMLGGFVVVLFCFPHRTCLGIQHSAQQRVLFQVRWIEHCPTCQKGAPLLLTRQRLLDREDRLACLMLETDKRFERWANRGTRIPYQTINSRFCGAQRGVLETQQMSSVFIMWASTKETRVWSSLKAVKEDKAFHYRII